MAILNSEPFVFKRLKSVTIIKSTYSFESINKVDSSEMIPGMDSIKQDYSCPANLLAMHRAALHEHQHVLSQTIKLESPGMNRTQ